MSDHNSVFQLEDSLDSDSLIPPVPVSLDYSELLDIPTDLGSSQNVITLALLLVAGLLTNLSAFPVILFRRTRYSYVGSTFKEG